MKIGTMISSRTSRHEQPRRAARKEHAVAGTSLISSSMSDHGASSRMGNTTNFVSEPRTTGKFIK